MAYQHRNEFGSDIANAINAGSSFMATMESHEEDFAPSRRTLSPADLRLLNKKIPVRYCEFKITNTAAKMLQTETVSVSNMGLIIHSTAPFSPGTLMRVWVDMPDYWARKSRLVPYRHTNAPTYFQVLSRVVSCDDISKRTPKFQILCENVNLDPVDERVLCEYLGIEFKSREA
jgi:hypothetical protein